MVGGRKHIISQGFEVGGNNLILSTHVLCLLTTISLYFPLIVDLSFNLRILLRSTSLVPRPRLLQMAPSTARSDDAERMFFLALIADKGTITRAETDRLAAIIGGGITWNACR